MYDCFVRIASHTEEGSFRECVRGRLQTVSEGYSISYLQDGDAVSVLAADRFFSMKRAGAASLEGYFSLEGASYLRFFWGGNCGEMPVTVRKYALKKSEKCLIALLSYTLDSKEINLKMTIDHWEEK